MVIVDEVHLAVEEAQNDRTIPSRKLRSFQKEFSVCAKDEEAEVIQLIAPTGAGKTLCFENLMRDENEEIHKTVLIYPTNALIKSQLERFRKNKFAVINISSKNLTKKGKKEVESFLDFYHVMI